MKPGMYLQKWSSNNKHPLIEIESQVIAVLKNGSEIKVSMSEDGTELRAWHKNPHTGQLVASSSGACNVLRLAVIDNGERVEKLEAELAKVRSLLKELKEFADRAEEDF